MKKNNLLKTFLRKQKENISITKGKGIYLYSNKGRKYTDLTAGSTGHALLGWGNKEVINAINNQIKKFGHVDYKILKDPNREKLANLLCSKTSSGLNRIFFVGSSGSEACEAAMKMSYQFFYDTGHKHKKIFISRKQSYHGSTTDAISLGDRPNLNFYKPILNKNVKKVSEHNQFRHKKSNETDDQYSLRCVNEIEKKILEIGPEKICGFIGETIMGGLVGDVPPPPNYWKRIRKVCDKYNIHLILDEVWCGTGTSGKIFCIDWDKVKPDFVFLSKTLAAGYGALSAVATNKKIESGIKKGQGQIQYSNTHQGHSLSIAAALSVQQIFHNERFLNSVYIKGNFLRKTLNDELKNNEFFFNVRGRGLRNSLEYKCDNNHLFGTLLKQELFIKYNTFIDSKWHRLSLPLALTISKKELEISLDKIIQSFKKIQKNWPNEKKKSNKISQINFIY